MTEAGLMGGCDGAGQGQGLRSHPLPCVPCEGLGWDGWFSRALPGAQPQGSLCAFRPTQPSLWPACHSVLSRHVTLR